MKKYHYVYRITNILTNTHYYGCRTSFVKPCLDNYWSSCESLKNDIKNIGIFFFKKKIIKIFKTRKKAIEFEIFLHNKFNVGLNPKFYNKVKQSSIKFDTTGIPHVFKGKKWPEISAILKNRPSPHKGKTYEQIMGNDKAQKLKKQKSIFFKNKIVTNITRLKMKQNHWSTKRSGGTTDISGTLYDANDNKIFDFNSIKHLCAFCIKTGIPHRPLIKNSIYNPSITNRNKKFIKFIGFYIKKNA